MTTQTLRSEPARARWEVALEAAEYHRPTRCPHCSSAEVCPMFDPDMILWLCTDCNAVFSERD